ncbi:MAG: RNB domain-containing ribonuclease, partial [Clostridia bacterium]|nr:RNB domain-containing ribonuclease [Clostridia bacterium]
VVDSNVFEGVIKSKHKMNYDDCNAIIKGDLALQEKYPDVTPVLLQMVELMTILEKRREKLGAVVFDVPELKIILNDKKEIETFKAKPHDVAERLIESFMICANETISRTFERKKIPFVYRIHEKPDSLKVDAFKEFISGFGVNFVCDSENLSSKKVQEFLTFLKDKPYNLVANKLLIRCMSKAKYSPEQIGHYDLALKDYTHFTSPIRRYCDLTIHRIIKKVLKNQVEGTYKNQLKMFVVDASARASSTEVVADKCERDVDDYFKARYMKDKIGEEYEGTINGTIDGGIFVELDNTVEGFVSVNDLPGYNYSHNENRHLLTNGNNTYQMGDRIWVKVESVDMARRKINFVLKDYVSEDFDLSSIDFGEGHTYKKNNDKKHISQYDNPFTKPKKYSSHNGKPNSYGKSNHKKNKKSRKNKW